MINFLMRSLAGVTFFLILGCTNQPVSPSRSKNMDSRHHSKRYPPFNLSKFAQSIGMDMPVTETGFHQKSFNDCQLPRHLRKTGQCATQYLNILNFRMRCRDSSGTVESVSRMELTPIRSRRVNWKIADLNGFTTTSPNGYARVRFLSHGPIGKKQFIVSSNGKIMGVSAEEVRQFVLPNYWCE